MTAVHFSKQNSTFLAEFNSNLKISWEGSSPPATSMKIELNRINFRHVILRIVFDNVSKRLQFVSNLPVPKRLCIETTINLASETFLRHLESQELWEKLSFYVIHSVADLRRWCSYKLFSSPTIACWTQLNFVSKPAVHAWNRLMFTFTAGLSQVDRRHMRTRLYSVTGEALKSRSSQPLCQASVSPFTPLFFCVT